MSNAKKIGLFTLVAFNVGNAIGSGFLATLPQGIALIGPGVLYAWLAAAVMQIFLNLPSIIPSSSLPCPASAYTLQCRLIHPAVGYLEVTSILYYIVVLTVMSTYFSDYLDALVPGIPKVAVSIGIILLFWLINLRGVNSGTAVQNIIVITLLISLGIYVVTGVPHMDGALLTASDLFLPQDVTFLPFCTVLAMFYSCVNGCFDGCLDLADQIKNPRKNLIRAGCLSALCVCALYCAVSVVTCGIADWRVGVPVLSDLAKTFMPRGLWYLFMIGGAIFAILSTINAMVLSVGYRLSTMAGDKVFPEVFNRTCRFGTKPLCLTVPAVAAIVIVVFQLPMGSLIALCGVLCILSALLRLLPLIPLPRRYPHTYRRAFLHPAQPLIYLWLGVGAVICVAVSISTIITTAGSVWWMALGTLAALYLYFVLRVLFLKGKGIDLFALMRSPYLEWDEKEAAFRREDEGEPLSKS